MVLTGMFNIKWAGMTSYTYKALNEDGNTVTGVIDADTKKLAGSQISQKQLVLLELQEKKSVKEENKHKDLKVPQKAILVFTKQLLSLSRAGLPLVDSLELLSEQADNDNLRIILEDVCDQLKGGKSFSEALKQYPQVFTELYVNSIYIGEVSGNLDKILLSITERLESDMQLKKDLKKAFRYPMFVISVLFIAFVIFVTFVIPRFAPIFEKSRVELPLPTRMIMSINTLFSSYGILVIFVMVIIVIAIGYIYKTDKGKYLIHLYILKLPVYGNLIQKMAFQRFASTLALLNRHGIPLVQAMNTAIRIEPNKVFRDDIRYMQTNLEKGQKIASAMSERHLFSNLMIHMVSVGEVTGSIHEMLENAADYSSTEIKEIIENITVLIEPVVTIILALMVLLLALSIFLPMWNMLGIL
jgi:type II secretory pathway component PulF